MGIHDSWGHDTNCVIGGAMNGLGMLIFGNVYPVPVIPNICARKLLTQVQLSAYIDLFSRTLHVCSAFHLSRRKELNFEDSFLIE